MPLDFRSTRLVLAITSLAISLTGITTLHAAATIAADFPAAKQDAATAKADIVILIVGSDWCKPSIPYLDAWNHPTFQQSLPDSLVLLTLDNKENPDATAQALAEKNKDCSLPTRSVPALAYLDSQGRIIATYSGTPELGAPTAANLTTLIKKAAQIRSTRDQAWARAEQVQKTKRAEALGAGLDAMNQGLGHQNVYKQILDEITKADPQDQSGYTAKYSFPGHNLAPNILDTFVKDKKFKEAEAELLRWHRNPHLSSEQRQQLHAARFALYRAWPEKSAMVRTALEDMVKEAPTSDLGLSAKNYLLELYPPLTLEKGWRPLHFEKGRSKWKIDVSSAITAPGTYELTFQYTQGADALQIFGARLIDRQGVLASDGHEGSTGSQNKDNIYRFEVKRRPVGTIHLSTEVDAGENDDSHGTFTLKLLPSEEEKK